MSMGLDPEIMALLDSTPQPGVELDQPQAELDPDVLQAVDRAQEDEEARKTYLRDRYVWGLVAPLTGTRKTYADKLIKEVTDPGERRWLLGEVARVAKVQDWAERKDYNEAGYFGRFAKRAEKVGGSFAEAGTGMLGAVDDLLDFLNERTDTADDVRYLRALEGAKSAENPYVPEDIGLAGKAATGAAGMVPDVAAGMGAFMSGGPVALAGYTTARGFGESRKDYLELGLGHKGASLAGLATAGAEGAIESINIDPTGLTGKAAAPLKAGVRTGMKRAITKMMGESAGEAAEKALKSRVTAETVGALKRTGTEAFEEFAQGGTSEAGKYLAGQLSPAVEKRPAVDILSAAYGQAKEALPGLAVMGGVGGAARGAGAVSAKKEISAQQKIADEVMDYANEGKVPSRKKWKAWGMPAEEGLSRKQRRDATQVLSDKFRAVEQVKAVIGGKDISREQWNRIGLPKEDGWTPESRQAFLKSRFSEEAVKPEATAEEAAAEEPMVPAERATTGRAPSRPDFPMEKVGTGKRVSSRETVRKLESIWGIPIFKGGIKSKGARAIYKTFTEVARLARGEESSVAVVAHEVIGHHVDKSTDLLSSAPEAARAELGALDYDQGKQRESEGFAEFMRAYMTGGIETAKAGIDLNVATPKFLEHFEQWVEEHPEFKKKIQASQAPILELTQAGAVGRVKGQVSQTGVEAPLDLTITERLNNWKEYLYTKVKEEGRPVKRFVEAAMKRGYKPDKTTPFEDYNALRQIGPHFAMTAIENGVFRMGGNMEKIGPSLKEVLADISPGEDYENFVAYAYARHAIESWSKDKNPGITLDDAHEVVRRLGSPRYEAAADGITAFNNALVAVLVETGAVDPQMAAKIMSEYKTYIPLERAMPSGRPGDAGKKMVDLSQAIHGRRGSGLQIIDPIDTTITRAVRMYERAATQTVTNNLIRVAQTTQGLGGWVDEVPAKQMKTQFSWDEVRPQVLGPMQESLGISKEEANELLDKMDPMAALAVWRPNLAKINGVPIVRVMQNGQQKFYQMRPELAESLGGLEAATNLDFAAKMARSATGLLKVGATRLNVNFVVSNALRDYQTFLLQGEKGLKGAFDPAKYAMAYVTSELQASAGGKKNPVVEQFQNMGGELSSFVGLDRTRVKRTKARTLLGQQSGITTAVNVMGATEMAPRIAEFALNLEKQGWLERVRQGETPPMDVLIKSINAAHDVTTDFRRMGSWGRYANYFLPFLNARMEGFDKFVRTFKDHPTRSSMRAAMYIVPRAMLYWWLRHDDDDYKERPRWQDGYFILKDSEGNPAYRIPRSHEWGMIGTAVERMMDAMYDKDPEAMDRWFESTMKTINPVSGPAGVTPVFETAFNYDSLRDRPIVSEQLQARQAPDQYYEYTSKAAKTAARVLHDISGGKVSLSPAKIDHLANGLTGGLYGNVNSPIEKIASGGEWAAAEVPGLKGITLRKDYPKSISDFYSDKERLDKAHESAKLRDKEEEVDQVKRRRYGYISSLMSDMRKAALELPTEEKRQVDLAMGGLARAALGRDPLERYVNPIENYYDLPKPIQVVVESHIAKKAITAAQKNKSLSSIAAAEYLRTMNVNPDQAAISAYMHQRLQGFSADTSDDKADRIRKLLSD